MFVLENDCTRHALSVDFIDAADMCTVVVQGGLEVPALYGVIVPGGACVGILMF